MPRIAIPKVRDDRPAAEYRVRLDPKLNDELALYGRLYEEAYGQPIEPKDLIEPILRRFLAGDRAFRGFRKRHERNTKATAAQRGAAESHLV